MKILSNIVMLFATCVSLISCGDEHVYFPHTGAATGASVKFIHASSDASSVGFFLDDAAISSSVSFGNSFPITGYSFVSAGNLNVDAIVPATEAEPAVTLTSGAANVTASSNYTIAVLGRDPNYEIVVIADDLSGANIESGKSYIRLINFMENSANGLKLEMTPAGGVLFTPATNIAFKSGSAFIEVEPGSYSSIVVKDAVDGTSYGSAASSIRTLSPNKVYTFFGKGVVGGTTSLSRVINR